MHTLRTRLVGAGMLVALSLGACHTVGEVGYPAEFVETNGPTHVWVTTADQSVLNLYNPQVHGDTLVGFIAGVGTYTEMPISDVKIMRANFPAPGRTAVVVAAGAIGAAVMVAALMGSNGNARVCYKSPTGEVIPCPDNPNVPPVP